MKKIFSIVISLVSSIAWVACHRAEVHYVDLNSGEKIRIEKDEHGRLVNVETQRPVRFYIDSRSKDTLDGRTGKVVNGELVKVEDGSYEYISVREFLAEEDFKKKVDEDGDVKIKSGGKKIKIDGKTGEKKVKNN